MSRNITYICNFDVSFKPNFQENIVKKCGLKESVELVNESYKIKSNRTVVVVGSGPAGLFAARTLSEANVKVVLLERGEPVLDRVETVNKLLKEGKLNKESNIQFGEGGAGTFSDGKLNTGISSPLVNDVLKTFHECGAEENVLYDAKPHIGTDHLRNVVVNLRNKIIKNGGNVLFNSKFIDFNIIDNKVYVKFIKNNNEETIVANDLV